MNSLSAPVSAEAPATGRTTRGTVLAGLLAFVPVVCALGAFMGFASFLLDVTHLSAEEAGFPAGGPMAGPATRFYATGALLIAGAATSLIAFAYFLIDAMVSPHLPQDSRAVWAVVLLFGNVVGFPVYYWYVAWWRRRAR